MLIVILLSNPEEMDNYTMTKMTIIMQDVPVDLSYFQVLFLTLRVPGSLPSPYKMKTFFMKNFAIESEVDKK